MNITCAIIEDLKVAADYLAKCCEKSGVVEVKGSFPDAGQALTFLNECMVDLLFLDVEMPGPNGFELLDNLVYRPKVILTTSKEEYAYNAFEYHVTDFLKKPFTYKRFTEALEKLDPVNDKLQDHTADHIYIRSEGKLIRLNNDDILYIESMRDYVRFVTSDKKYLTHNSIKDLEDKVNKNCFMRVHRRYIINLFKIEDIRETYLYINGIEIPISRAHKSDVLRRLTIL